MTREPEPKSPSSAFRLMARGLVALHRLMREGQGDSLDADSTRDALDAPWACLNDVERRRARFLSEDLHSISGVSDERRGLPADSLQASQKVLEMFGAIENRQWDLSLQMLRVLANCFAPAQVSYLRGRVWSEAGLPEVAVDFFGHASASDPQNAIARCLYMEALSEADPAAAAAIADDVLANDVGHDPKIVAQAATIRFQRTEGVPESESVRVYRDLVDVLMRNLERIEAAEGVSDRRWEYEITAGKLGLCHELLGNSQKAVESFSLGLQANPDNDGLLVARGILTYGTSPRAVDDFRRAIGLRSSVVWPYLFLAHNDLVAGRFDECRKMCEAGIGRVGSDAAKSRLEEWRAIAQSELGFPPDLVRMAFDSALRLDPGNESARLNLQVVESSWAARRIVPPFEWVRVSVAAIRQFGLMERMTRPSVGGSIA